jgi:hypothetical protein
MDNQEVELHDDENSVVDVQEAEKMPVGTEEESIASVSKAEDGGKKAKARKGDKSNSEKMDKVQAGDPDKHSESYDFEAGLNGLMEEEATLSEEFKAKTAVIFEAALKSKLSEEVSRLEEEYETRLNDEVSGMHAEVVEKVDSYLNYVVENWMEENKIAIQNGLRTEIAEDFMTGLKGLFEESYIDVPESKVDLVDGLAEQVEELEEKLNTTTEQVISMTEELVQYKRAAIVREAAEGLAATQVEKLNSLVESLDFEDEETFASKVATVKESYFKKAQTSSEELVEETSEDADDVVVSSSSMDRYLSALRQTNR